MDRSVTQACHTRHTLASLVGTSCQVWWVTQGTPLSARKAPGSVPPRESPGNPWKGTAGAARLHRQDGWGGALRPLQALWPAQGWDTCLPTPSLPGGSSETQPPRAVSCRCHSGPPRPVALTPPPFRKSPVPQESGWISGAQRHTPSPEWIVPASASLALGTGAALQPLGGAVLSPGDTVPDTCPLVQGPTSQLGHPRRGLCSHKLNQRLRPPNCPKPPPSRAPRG